MFYLFFRHWKCIFEINPSFWVVETSFIASGHHLLLISQILLSAKVFFRLVQIYFYKNPLLWLVVTDFLASGNHFVAISQIPFLLGTRFKRILYYGQWQWILCLMRTIFFHSYFLWSTIIVIKGRPILKNILKSYFC